MPTWLIVIIAITACFAIIAFIYMILAFRRIMIVYKKTDYLVEDLTYKSEKLNDTVSTIAKVANYIESAEDLVKNNAETINNILTEKSKKSKTKSEASKHE